MQAYVVYSDDGGETWARGEAARNPEGGFSADEVSMVELEDGSILLNSRIHNGGPKRRLRSRSTDGGRTFLPLEVDDGLVSPHCMGSIVLHEPRDRGFERSRLLYAGPWREQGRASGSIVASSDGASLAIAASSSAGPGSPARCSRSVSSSCSSRNSRSGTPAALASARTAGGTFWLNE